MWHEMRKVLIKSRETGQDLTRSRVPAKVSASLLQYLTNLVTDGEHFKEEVKKKLKELSSIKKIVLKIIMMLLRVLPGADGLSLRN